MSINIITSRQRAGENPARDFLINKIIDDYKNSSFLDRRKIFIITPKQNTYQVERELIEKIGDGGLFGVDVIDQDRLLKMIYEENQDKLEVIDEHGRLMLMQKTLKDVQKDLKIYNRSVKKAGFSQELIEQLSELKSSQISDELLDSKLDSIDSNLLKEKVKDLSLIIKKFNENLGDDRIDEDDLRNISLDLISQTDYFKDSRIYFLDFNSLDVSDTLLLAEAAKKAKSVNLALTTDLNKNATDFSAFSSVNNSIDLIKKLAKSLNTEIEIIPLNFNRIRNDSLSHLSENLFSYSPKTFNHPLINVSIFSENDPWNEVNRVAQLIALENKQGQEYSKIAVTVPDSQTYENLIKRVFSQYNIPIFIDDNHQVIDNHFIQTVLNALEAADNNFRRNEILSFLKSDFSNLTRDEIDLFENYLIEAGIKNWEWKKPFKRIPKSWGLQEDELSEDHPINLIRDRIVNDLKIFNKKKNKTFNDYANSLISFLEKLGSQQKLEEISEDLFNEGNTDLSLRYRQIWNILIEILDQLKTTLGDSPTDLTEFITVLRTGLTSYEVGVIPENNEAVIIARLDRSILPEINSLYFLGLNEGLLPREQGEGTLFSQREKSDISQVFGLGNHELKTNQFFHIQEENQFYNFISKPVQNITFTYSNFDSSGSPQLPSRYVNILENIFGPKVYPPLPKIFPILNSENADIILETLNINEQQNYFSAKIIADWLSNQDETIEVIDEIESNTLKTVKAEDLYNFNIPKISISISRLEQFAQCPYKHFLLYGIRPKNREEYEVRALDTGIIIHEVFDTFIKRLKDRTQSIEEFKSLLEEYLDDPKILEKDVSKIFDNIFEKLEESNRYNLTAASRYLVKKIKRIVYVSLLIMSKQMLDSNFIPDQTEQSFYEDEEDFILGGRIDRIDIPIDDSDQNIRVIDYKTGSKEVEYFDIYYGLSLQLALYLLKAVENYNKNTDKQVKPGGSLYFLTDNTVLNKPKKGSIVDNLYSQYRMNGIYTSDFGKKATGEVIIGKSQFKPNNLTDDELDQLLQFTKNKVDKLAHQLKNGDIQINPITSQGEEIGCRYCSYRDICRFNPDLNEGNEIGRINKDTFFELIGNEDE